MRTDNKTHSKSNVRYASLKGLEKDNLISPDEANSLRAVEKAYAIGISDNVIDAISAAGDAGAQAIIRQYFPDIREMDAADDETDDPIGDDVHSPVKGIVHRYPDRVLLKITHLCAVYCRFCFRREMVGPAHNDVRMSGDDIQEALDYIAGNKEIFEVILTGGDPLSLSVRQLSFVFDALDKIDHVKIIRLHTRVPIADPKRVTPEMIASFPKNKACYICLHVNHAAELTEKTRLALRELHCGGCTLLSQSVLLKNVNDDPHVLEVLYRELLSVNVKPYYLHHPDKARGTKHFRLSIKRGQMIVKQLAGRLSGLAQPHYMLDIPGGFGKIQINSNALREIAEGLYELRDFEGRTHLYKD